MRVSTSFLICARSGQPAMVSFTPIVHVAAPGDDGDAGGHAEVDDVAAELGIDHAAEQPDDLVDGRRRASARRAHAAILPVAAV